MNLEDETLLSSYIDGELDEVRRLAVEAALLTRPRLAARLQELTRIRGLVASLARPTAPLDVSGAVVAEIRARGQLRAARRRTLVRRALVFGPALAASALIGLGLGPWGHRRTIREDHPPRAPELANRPGPGPIVPKPPRLIAPAPIERPRPPVELAATPPPAPPIVGTAEPFDSRAGIEERQAIAAREALAELLDQPEVRRIDLVVDTLGPEELNKVDEAINQTARTSARHARVRICQEIVIDPKLGEAMVYVMVLDGAEYRRFRDRLEERFPRQVGRPQAADPELVTRLADVGRLAIVEGTSAATLTEPPPELASRAALRSDADTLEARHDVRVADPLRPAISGPPRSPTTGSIGPIRGDRRRRRTESGPSRPSVYLVWVTTRHPADPQR